MKTAVILGAGFSFAGGLPLTRDLFDVGSDLPRSQTIPAQKNHEQVLRAYNDWRMKNPEGHVEKWFELLYELRKNPLQEMKHGTTWGRAVRFALARLVKLPPGSNTHYYYGIGNHECNPVHQQFWERVQQVFNAKYIVTLNYDIMVEQALHSDESKSRTAPQCYYGGFQHIQAVKKMNNVTTQEYELLQLGNKYVLYKLHGSVNWAWEPHSPTLKIHQDVRAVYRHEDKFGVPAIIPPIPEKEMPKEFAQIWNEASVSLGECSRWIICGYSLPPYDFALRRFFQNVLEQRKETTLLLLDPDSTNLAVRWREICSPSPMVVPLPGLPEAFEYSWTTET